MTSIKASRGFNAWVAATVGSELGSGVLAFALTWTASGHGPHVASAVLTLTVAPAVLLGLLGGAVADRFGPHRVMIICTLAMILVSAGLGVVVLVREPTSALLLITAVLIGTIAAFQRPASSVFPRLFVADADLGTAMARVGMASQFARTIAPPAGGLLVGLIALSGVAFVDVVGGVVMLVALLLITPPKEHTPAREAVTFRGIVAGVTTARGTDGVPALLACVAIVAGAVIPAVLLGIPLAARERGWSASEAGMIEAGWIAGGLACGAWFAWQGTAAKAWRPMALGPLIVAAGLGLLAIATDWIVALAGTTLIGVGVVVFTAHVFPTYVLLAPPPMVSRFQGLLMLVQQTPQLIVNPLIGFFVAAVGTGPVLAVSGLLATLATLTVVTDRTLRTFTTR
ncbi:MFS transporter [Microbacterium murale]|uniref:MFS family permease n=1 Tax=Microbacterium murale TaxID=1081040 RepID=A0ABU0PCV3_9MICO|nr:MFS transporter [Microbacterium murale]MDQ0645145.1 MFS family permease [Microbacterium murale]